MLTAGLRGDAACARGNRASVWAGARMAEERADAVRGFGREDVFELASLLRDFFLIVDVEGLGKQALGQAMAADHVLRSFATLLCEDDHVVAVASVFSGWTKSHMTAVQHLFVRVR